MHWRLRQRLCREKLEGTLAQYKLLKNKITILKYDAKSDQLQCQNIYSSKQIYFGSYGFMKSLQNNVTWLNKQGCSIPSFYVNTGLQQVYNTLPMKHLIGFLPIWLQNLNVLFQVLFCCEILRRGRVNFSFREYFSSIFFYKILTCFSWKIWVLAHVLLLPTKSSA